ncbi:MAG: ribokinase [Treponema sp.]|jgi:ribokinase|nr:ribokinase [Treponema sp.]
MARFLNFGSLNIDYVYRVDHFARSGETLAALDRETFVGGKGLNQSIALARAGAQVFHAGCCGAEDGEPLLEALRRRGVDVGLIRKTAAPSGHAIIQVDREGRNCILLFGGANESVTETQARETLARFGEGDVLLLQNEISRVSAIAEMAVERGLRIAYNPSPANDAVHEALKHKLDFIILNEIEARMISGAEDSRDQLEALAGRFPQTAIALTRGREGAFYRKGAEEYRHGIYDVAVKDTTAAGDTFTGFFIARLLQGDAPPEALRLASIAASLAVSRPGASPSIPSLEEVYGSSLRPAGPSPGA